MPSTSPLILSATGFSEESHAEIARCLGGQVFGTAAGSGISSGLHRVDREGPAASGSAEVDGSGLEPGEAVAILLIDGDARLAATGTVSERRGDDILAFGHPFLGIGPVSLPMARARVEALVASQQISFKLAVPTAEVGALLMDRQAGVLGRLGAKADMIPLHVELHGPGDHPVRTFDFRLARLRSHLAPLAQWSVQSVLGEQAGIGGEKSLRMRVEIHAENDSPLVMDTMFTGPALGQQLAAELAFPLQLLAFNPDRSLRLESLRIRLEVAEGFRSARVGKVILDPPRPRPGQDLGIRFELIPYRGDSRWESLSLSIPPETAPGRYLLHLNDGGAAFAEELMRALERWSNPSLSTLREGFTIRRPASDLVAVLYGPAQGSVVEGRELRQLPPSMRSILERRRGETVLPGVIATPLARKIHPTDWVLQASEQFSLEIIPQDRP